MIVGALVSGPDVSDHFRDARADAQGATVAIDYNANLVALLSAVLQLEDSFWEGGNLTRMAVMCEGAQFYGYDWGAAPF